MKKQNIRHDLFESNSSSSHSITISDSGTYTSISPDYNGEIVLAGGEFGWGWEKHSDALTKANYLVVYATNYGSEYKVEKLINVIEEHTGAKVKICINDNNSYIDHQSTHVGDEVFDQDKIKEFIFNPKSTLFIGNDNSSGPPNFYDDENTKYIGELSLEGTYQTIKLKEKPSQEELKNFLYQLFERNDYSRYNDCLRYNDYSNGFSIPWVQEDGIKFVEKNHINVIKDKLIYDKKGEFVKNEIIEIKKLKFNIKYY